MSPLALDKMPLFLLFWVPIELGYGTRRQNDESTQSRRPDRT
jgi:hypothetical protein